ncbi:hypothetical protein [Shewanella surugensis]|uniref:Uncharacterized protein n=1 Tax=Shewanella surugensis TaxID=212020 RepID=A0ABT0LKG0_9GAMM|nr:hypothetical protein [Shewanella surugensis]MCL1127797.1 hypothetical protein [Shewanella surugensis]
MDSDEIQVFYPTWIKVMGIIFLPIMVPMAIWLGLRPIWETDLTDAQIVLFPIMGVAVLYQCTIGFRCFKYFSTTLVLHDTGVNSYTKGIVEEYLWTDLEVKSYS